MRTLIKLAVFATGVGPLGHDRRGERDRAIRILSPDDATYDVGAAIRAATRP